MNTVEPQPLYGWNTLDWKKIERRGFKLQTRIYYDLKQNHGMQLVTVPRKGMDKSPSRQRMIHEMLTARNRKAYKQRATTVEPMQGLVAAIFELNRCWMRAEVNNRWLFAAMGIAVQIAQWTAWREHRSTWDIKNDVLGV